MRGTLMLIVALVAVFAMSDDVAAQTTCSYHRERCIAQTSGRSIRGAPGQGCYVGYEGCMKTGVWDTTQFGAYGVRRTGVAKR
jgi:hypothetical protein